MIESKLTPLDLMEPHTLNDKKETKERELKRK